MLLFVVADIYAFCKFQLQLQLNVIGLFVMSLKLGDETLCCWQPEDASGQLDYRYDEFGFKVEEEGAHVVFIVL